MPGIMLLKDRLLMFQLMVVEKQLKARRSLKVSLSDCD